MTQNPVPPSQRRPVWDAAAGQPVAAVHAMQDRVFHLTSARGVWAVPQFLTDVTGFALCGELGEKRMGKLAGIGKLPVAADTAPYEKILASVAAPLPQPATLTGLEGFFDDMKMRSATVVFTPTGYLEAGEPAALKAVRDAVNKIKRSDVVVAMPIDVTYLRDNKIDQLIAVLKTIPYPIALILGGQYNPTDLYADIVRNLRRIYQEVGRVGLWRTDLVSGLDCMAYGGMFAGIGGTSSLRHLTPPRQKAKGGGNGLPSVFIPDLLGYFRTDTLAKRWANSEPLPCYCVICEGDNLDRFNGRTGDIKAAAHAHNTASWNRLWSQMQVLRSLPERQAWLTKLIRSAELAYESENERIEQLNGFEMSKTLERMVKLAQTVSSTGVNDLVKPASTPVQ